MSIWDERQVDWRTGEGLGMVQLFERAYPDRAAARAVIEKVGLTWPAAADMLGLSALWVVLLTDAARTERTLDLAAELLSDPGKTYFVTPLRTLLGKHLGQANAHRVSRHGLPKSAEAARAVIETLEIGSAAGVIIPASAGELQSINLPGAGLQGIGEVLRVLLDARRRVALVRRRGAALGTGFLVAPDWLLTAAHVLRPDGQPGPTDIEDVDAVFDFFDERTTRAETGTPVPVADLLRTRPPSPGELPPVKPDWNAPADRLDYALLRLPRRVGDDRTPDTTTRGHYALDVVEPDLSQSGLAHLFHFPLASFLSHSYATSGFEFNPSGTRTRMRYQTNTLPGSSGAPIVDQLGRLLAMHHFGNPQHNQAVPIWLIARAVQDLVQTPTVVPCANDPQAVTLTTPRRPHMVLQVGPRPLVNREPLRTKVWAAMTTDDTARSLVIVGATESGVSWSYWLLSHIAAQSQAQLVPELRTRAPQGVEVIKIDLREDINKPPAERRATLVRAVTQRISSDVSEVWIAQVARQVDDFRHWCYKRLVGNKRQWWVFVDSIDEITEIKRHGIDEILLTLVDLADDPQTSLRLVLAGREADKLGHKSLQWAENDRPVGLSREEVKRWLEDKAEQAGAVIRSDRLDAFLDQWFQATTTAARPGELALALPRAVKEVCA